MININYTCKPSYTLNIINKKDNNLFTSEDTSFLPILFSNSIDHILFAKPFFMTKKILNLYNIKNFRYQSDIKVVFPPISFINLSEEEKERFLESRNLGYIKDKRIIKKDSNMLYNSFNEISGNNEYSFDIPDSVFLNNNIMGPTIRPNSISY